jgi:hypothetical protein
MIFLYHNEIFNMRLSPASSQSHQSLPPLQLSPPSSTEDTASGLFIVSDGRMKAYIHLLSLVNNENLLTTIKTGIEVDLFVLLMGQLNKKTKRMVTDITLLKTPKLDNNLEPAAVEVQEEKSLFLKAFKHIINGEFSNLQAFHSPYPLDPTQWTSLINAHLEARIQLTTLDLTREARALNKGSWGGLILV